MPTWRWRIGVMHLQANEWQKLPVNHQKLEEARKDPSRTGFRGNIPLLIPWFQTCCCQNYKRINFCCSTPPSLWYLVSADLAEKYNLKTFQNVMRASLVAQWLRVCLLVQGTRVRALVWEDPTWRGAAGPVSHNCWACVSGACAPQQERPRWWEARAPWWRVAPACHN